MKKGLQVLDAQKNEKTMMLLGAGFPMLFKGDEFKDDGKGVDVCTTESITNMLISRVYEIKLETEFVDNIDCLTNCNKCSGNTYLLRPGEILFNILKKKIPETNFETIINALESLISYYNGTSVEADVIFGLDNTLSNILKHIDHTRSCIIVDGQPVQHGPNRCKEVKFLESIVFEDFMRDIIDAVSVYNNHIRGNSFENTYLHKYIENIMSSSSLRVYTTNYDDTFSYLFPGQFFNGFSELLPYPSYDTTNRYQLDAEQILNNNGNVCYNLHGSIFWIKHNWMSDRYCYRPEYTSFFSVGMKRTEEGNPKEVILSSPIITGYRKAQRIIQYPFSLLYNTFERDIYAVKDIVIMGYSFGDAHLNRQIRIALERGVNVKIVTFLVDAREENTRRYIYDIIEILKLEDGIEIFNKHVKIYVKGVEEFLEKHKELSIQ